MEFVRDIMQKVRVKTFKMLHNMKSKYVLYIMDIIFPKIYITMFFLQSLFGGIVY